MRPHDENLMRFVRRVHRRLVVVRALERAGACVAVASIFACAFAAIALIQGRDAMQLVLPTLLIGALVGILWGFVRRPTRFDAVTEADRQLALSDLLATAYAQRDADDPWQLAVIALADARCRALSPDAVVVHRYGGRAWGGIGLAAATGLTLALLTGVPQPSRARPAEASSATATAGETADESLARSANAAPQSVGVPRASEWNAAAAIGADASATDDATRGVTSDDAEARPGRDAADGGDRPGETTAASGEGVPRPRPRDPRTDSTADATTVAGGGASAAAALPTDFPDANTGTTSAGDHAMSPQTPPWSLPRWGADRAAATSAIRAGRVPDAYRDVVTEYFRDAADAERGLRSR